MPSAKVMTILAGDSVTNNSRKKLSCNNVTYRHLSPCTLDCPTHSSVLPDSHYDCVQYANVNKHE